jgi:outer membrane protein assembly factor BamB
MIRFLLLLVVLPFPMTVFAADWPMWRADTGRTARNADPLPANLSVRWVRQLHPLRPAYRHHRLGFDGGYEPIITDGRLYLASSLNDSVTAYNASTGKFLWSFYTNGPVRFAPVAHRGKLYFGSDDGHLYCLNATDGKELWRFRAVPSSRTVLGNRRVISVWPIRGGPVLAGGTLYFAAGVWPFEGVFVYALDPETGDVKWLNDHTGHLYGVQPHNARSIGGLTPQGYLLVNGDELVVPCSAGRPARFNRITGKLIRFEPPSAGRQPGGWFASLSDLDPATARAVRRGQITYDSVITGDRHEDKKVRGEGVQGLRSQVIARDRVLKFAKPPTGVEGTVHAMAIAQEMLFVSTVEGRLYALGKNEGRAINLKQTRIPLKPVDAATQAQAESILKRTKINHGLALVLGAADGKLINALTAQSPMRFLVIESDIEVVNRLRQRWDQAGIYGSRVVIRHEDPVAFRPPPYVANLILCEDPNAAGFERKLKSLGHVLNALRPFGGVALLRGKVNVEAPAGARINSVGPWTTVRRNGALPGTTNYAGDWKESRDELVSAPLGVLWFDDNIGHFKRSPQPLFIDGVMVSQPKDWSDLDRRPYPLKSPTFTDVYTGRRIDPGESLVNGKTFTLHDAKKKQPGLYRPAHLDDNGKLQAKRPDLGKMVNSLNGYTEKRLFPKSYGCDGGIDYGQIISMRSGTAAFYDKRLESGTIHISGPRSGCTNSIIPANGLLNLPYFYEGCTCSYPLPVALSMVKLPQTHEQWASYGEMNAKDIGRVGLNFGAPGDRMTDSGTLWLDIPSVGGPSPALRATVEPATAKAYYHHGLWIRGGRGWPWVAASGIRGIRSLKIEGLRPVAFTVRLTFAETENTQPGRRKFSVQIQGQQALEDFDPVVDAGGAFLSYVHETQNVKVAKDGVLQIHFQTKTGETILSGVELGTKALPLGPVPALPKRRTQRLWLASQEK